jgi:hypothetical protein
MAGGKATGRMPKPSETDGRSRGFVMIDEAGRGRGHSLDITRVDRA